MEHPHFIIAFTGNPQAGKDIVFRNLTAGKWFLKNTANTGSPFPNGSFLYASYKYGAIEFPDILSLYSPMKEAGYTAEYICSGKSDIIAVTGHALQLERLLHLLKEIISLDQVKDRQIPVVLCLSYCDVAEQNGVSIDISLLHDVLQIPIVPLHGFGHEQMDDLKAAFHYSVQPRHKTEFLYNCLDFSPAKLARECILIQPPDTCSFNESRSSAVQKNSLTVLAVLLAFVFWITSLWTGWFMDHLWPVLSYAEANLAAWSTCLEMPVWFTGCIVHGAFQSACWVILATLPPFSLFFPMLGLLENAGYFPRVRAAYGTAKGIEYDAKPAPGYDRYASTLATHVLILAIAAITPDLLPLKWPSPIPLPQPFMILRLFCCTLSGAAAAIAISHPHAGLFRQSLCVSPEISGPRKPAGVFKSIFRSTACCTLPLLNNAVLAAVPAGIILWLLGNLAYTGPEAGWLTFISPGQHTISLLSAAVNFLTPPAQAIGLDGTILAAFLAGLTNHWFSIPVLFMTYIQTGPSPSIQGTQKLHNMLVLHSWTFRTVLCTFLFSLLHWSSISACLHIYRQTKPLGKATEVILVPTIFIIILCAATALGMAVLGI